MTLRTLSPRVPTHAKKQTNAQLSQQEWLRHAAAATPAELFCELNSGEEDQFGYSRAEGSYQLTEDTSVVSGKTYYTKSGEQYTPVSSPASGSLSSYYELGGAGAPINFMVVERSAVIKFDKHVASRVFSPDELENLDSYMMKYRKYGIVELLDNKLDGVHVSCAPLA